MQLLEIKKLLAESQLMALRAQMNTHFVFNCLNSIQECIVTQKYGDASLYLNKFSKLFRFVLDNSGKVMISLTPTAVPSPEPGSPWLDLNGQRALKKEIRKLFHIR